jgi:methylated-DNA-protein-cysteine methyltransferase-like protein
MTDFTAKVRAVVAKIPKGKVATYGQVAWMAGNPHAPRAVGMIMSRNSDGNKVPCHRVVASNGALTGYGMGGIGIKKQKLLAEGVAFKGPHVDLTKSLWKPK